MRFMKKQRRVRKERGESNPFLLRLQENVRRALLGGVGIVAAGAALVGTSSPASALPQGGEVAAGAADIAKSQAEMAIHQATENAVINWQSFNIAANERVNIFQPNAQAALLNRVLGGNPSEIFGTLTANGHVFLVNPAGVLFAPGAQVDAGAITAAAMNITNADFMAGKYAFVGAAESGKVINRGTLRAADAGAVALLGRDVTNEGVVVAKKGAAILAAAEDVTLDFTGDGKVTVVPSKAALRQTVTNKGIVEADGGLVFMTAATGDALVSSAVNQEGVVRAASLDGKAGAVRMTANDVRLAAGSVTDVSGAKAGTVEIGGGWQGAGDLAHAKNVTIERGASVRADATAADAAGGTVAVWSDGMTRFAGEITARGKGTGAGGAVETSGAKVQITGSVNASSEAGKAGEWLIDPGDIEVKARAAGDPEAGSQADVQTVTNSLNGGTSVTIQTANLTGNDDHSITVTDAINKTAGGDATLSLKATGSVNINADISSTAGKLNVDITSDTNHRAGGRVTVANGKQIKTLGGNVKIGGGLMDSGVGFANSQSAGEAGIMLDHAVINTTAAGTAGGNVELAGSTTADAAGVSLSGTTITAGTGKVTLIGKSTGSNATLAKGISIDGTSSITTRNVELRTDSLDLSGTITGDGDPTGSAKVWTLSDGKTINFGGGTGGLDLAGDTFTSTGKIQNFKKNTVGDAAKKANIVANGVTADEELEMYTGAGTLTISGTVSVASTHALTLGSKNAITGAGVLTTDALKLDAADATVNLTGTNAVKKLDGKAKALTLKNGGDLKVGEDTGLVTTNGADVEVTAGDLTVGAHGITNGAGAMKLKASGTLKLDANAEVKSTGAAATSLEANTVEFASASKVSTAGGTLDVKTDALTLPSGAQGVLSSTNGKVTVDTKTAGKKIAVGSSTPSDLVLPNLDFINSGTGEIQIGSANTGDVEIGTADVKAPLSVESGATLKFSGTLLNTGNKNTTFKANAVDFAAGANLAAGTGTMTMVTDSVTNWNDAAFADTNGAGTFVLKPKTAGNFTVGGTGSSTLVSDAGFGKLKAGNFYNVSIGAKDNVGTATLAGISAGNMPKYTSILTKGKIDITGTVHGTSADTLALHADAPGTTLGDGLFQSAPLEVGNLLLLGKGSMDLSTQANKIENIAADMADGDLKLKNRTHMKVAVVKNRTVTPEADVDGLKTKTTDIKLDAGQKLTVEGKLNSTGDTKIEADDLDLGNNKVNVGKKLTLEKATKSQAINIGTGAGDWNINNSAYGEIKIGGATQTGNININGATFKKPSDIETTGDVTLTGATKAGADGKSDMKIKAHEATLPTASDTLAVKNLDLDLSGGIDLGLGKINGQKDGKVTAKGASASQDIYISDNAADAPSTEFRIAYRTINNTLDGFGGFDVAGEKHVYFYGGAVKKSINAAGKLGVEVRDNLTIEGKGTKLKIGADPTQAGHDPASVITGGFTVKQGKTVHVKGFGGTSKENGAEINIQTGGNIHLEQGATLKVEGNYAQATLNARSGDVVLNEDAKVQVAPGSTPVWVDVTGNKLQLDARAQLDSGTDTVGALRVHTDEIVTPTADDNTTNIVGKSGLVITRKTNGDLTLNNVSTGAGLHVTSDQLNGKLFGKDFSELVLGDNRSQTVTIDGLEANNRVVVKTAETGKTVIGAGGLKVGTDGSGKDYKVTLTTGAIENSGGAGVMNIGEGSTLNLYTNSITNLAAHGSSPSVTGTGTLGIGTYNGSKTIGLGDGATGDLQLTNNKFTQVFGPNFSHYAIGNGTQGTINVANSSLGKDVTLQADNINFAGDMTLAADKTLVVNAKTAANQTAGKIKATKLAAVGGNIALEQANEIGTLAADALSVKVKSNALTIGEITTPAGAPVPSRTITGVKAGESGGTAGDVVLSADAMTFDKTVEGKGNLTVQQANAATNLNVGTAGTGLTLPENLFGGNKIKDGFKHVYLGREDATGATNVGGNLNFVDPTTIRSGKTAGSMTVDGSANIQTNGNALALESKDLTTAPGSKVNTGAGDLTLKTDKIDLNGKMEGTKALNILPMSHTQDINLGANDPTRLSLLNRYFSGNDRTFWEYEIVNIGDKGGGGRLYQSGVIDTPFTVNIQQAITSGTGGVNISGQINTNGRDYTVGSREVNLNNAQINADSTNGGTHGNVAIQADTLNHTGSTITGHGDVSFDTYTPDKTLNFGTPGAGGSASDPTFSSDIFSGTGLLRKNPDGKGFRKIRIGGTNAGDIKVGNVDLPEGLADTVSIKTKKDVTSTGVLKSVPTLEVEANSVNLTGSNEIKNLGNITSATGVTVETKGGTNVTGKITGNNAPINITNKDGGNVTIAPGGKIVGTGTSDVVIEAKGGAFKNKGGANAIQTAPGHRYVVHTEDSVENEIDGLVFEFRRYGTDYTQRNSITIPAGKNAMFYKHQPELKFYSTRAYGDDNSTFFNSTSGFYIQDDGNEKRRALDKTEVDYIRDHVQDSGTHNFGTTKHTNVNADVNTADGTVTNAKTDVNMRSGAHTYGSDSTIADEKITYKGHNDLNYKITVDYRIVPRVVTVKGKTETVTYNGNPHSYTGNAGVTFENFANGQTAATPGLLSGSVSYTPIADATKTTGYAQGAVHAGEYAVDLKNSTLSANNYKFKYVPGKLTIKPRDIHFTAPSGERIYGTSNDSVTIPTPSYTGSLVSGDSFAKYTVTAVDGGGNAVTERTGVGSYTMSLQGVALTAGSRSLATDYNITSTPGTLTIKKRPLTITAGDKSRVYGDANTAAGYVNNTAKVNVAAATATTGLVNGDAIDDVTETIDPSATVTTNAGTAGLWTKASAAHFSQGTDANYDITYVNGHFNITKRALTLAAGDKSRIYGTANSTAGYVGGTNLFRVKTGSLVNGDAISTVTETIDSRATVTTDAGTAGLKTQIASAVFGTGNANNYDISYEDGSFAITPRDLTLRAGNKTRIYGTENSTAVYTGGTSKFRADAATATTGLANGDTIADVDESTDALVTTNAGTAGLKTQITNARLMGNRKASNYNITYVDGGFDITKRDLYIKGGDKSRTYGDGNETAHYVNGTSRLNVRAADATTGLVNGDAISSVTETIDPTATATTNAGTAGLWTRASAAQFSHGTDANYNIHYTDGAFHITKRALTLAAGDKSRIYGTANATAGYVNGTGLFRVKAGTNLVNGDAVSTVAETIDSRATVTTDAGTAGLKTKIANAVFGTGNAANYDISYEDGSFAITPRDLTLRAGSKTRIYGTENSTAVYTGGTSKFRADASTATTGLVNGDAVADVDESTDALVTTNAGTAGLKTQIANARLMGNRKASNYNIHYVDGGFDITKRDLYIQAGDKSRAYGAANSLAQYVNGTSRINVRHADATTGLVNGDRISSITETIDPTAMVTTDAGTPHLWTRVSDVQFGSGLASNYTIHYADGSFAIVPREVLVTAGNASRDYGAPNPVVTEYTVERGDYTSERGLLAGDDLTGVATYYDAAITPQTAAGLHAGVIHVDPDSVNAGYLGATALSNYRFRYAPGALKINLRGFDMSTPEGRVVTTGSITASQIIANLSHGHAGSISGMTGGVGSMTGAGVGSASSFGGTSASGGNAGSYGGTSASGGVAGGYGGTSGVGGKSIGASNGVGTSTSTSAGSSANTGGNTGAGKSTGKSAGTGTAAGAPSAGQLHDTSFADGIAVDMPKDLAATNWQSRVVVASGGASEAHDYVEGADGSFGFDLAKTRGNYGIRDEIPGGTSEAIPVLFTDGGSRDLDGIYSVNYGSGKLAIKPASKKVEIPDPKEIRSSAEKALSFLYRTQNGVFQVTFGNGIVTLYPKDTPALDIVVGKDKKAERAVLASGLLTAIEDLGVTPVEIRAVYIFKEIGESAA